MGPGGRAAGGGKGSSRLFAPGELRVEPSPAARLKALARARSAPVPAREAAREENHRIMERLRRVAAEMAERFGLRYASLEAEREGLNAHYGICYRDGVIRIRLRHATTGRPLKESSLVDTVCHELAHLRHFDHSPRFKAFYQRILEEARRRGHYRPGPDERKVQRSLFDPETCGTRVPSVRAGAAPAARRETRGRSR